MFNQKGFSKITVIVAVVVLIGAGYFVYNNSKKDNNVKLSDKKNIDQKTTQTKEKQILTAEEMPEELTYEEDLKLQGWKTYRNEEYGFEFVYPTEFSFEVYGNDKFVEGSRCKIEIYFEPSDNEGKLQLSSCVDFFGKSGSNGPIPFTLDSYANFSRVFAGGDVWNKILLNNLNAIEMVGNKSYLNTIIVELPSKKLVEIAVKDTKMFENIKKSFKFFPLLNLPNKFFK